MERLGPEWVQELRLQIQNHMEYVPLRRRLAELELLYDDVMAELNPEQRAILLEFHRLNHKMEVFLSNQSYLLGIQVGERRAEHKDEI